MPNFAVGAAYVWRKNIDLSYYPRLSGPCSDPNNPTLATCPIITADLYTPVAPVTSGGYTVQGYAPPSALVAAGNSGRILTTQPGYSQNFNGVDVTLTKRLSNKWMGRVALTYNLFKQHYDSGVIPVNGVYGKNGQGSRSNTQGNPTPTDRNSLKRTTSWGTSRRGRARRPTTRAPSGRCTRTRSSSFPGTSSSPARSSAVRARSSRSTSP